jgi:hypothetical protein
MAGDTELSQRGAITRREDTGAKSPEVPGAPLRSPELSSSDRVLVDRQREGDVSGAVMGRQRNRVTGKGKGSRVRTLVVPLTLVVFLAPAACGSPTASDELLETLFGTWSWVQATGGIAGMTRTPVSEGYTRTLTFTRPNQVKMLRDGVPEVTTTFEFVSPIANGSAQLLYARPLAGVDEQWVEITEAGDQVLSDPCCDGFVYEWRRQQ